jgi:succinate-semialdehyde dehydrogenase / glutarate-semialdehyde dehydrogenase
MIDTINPATEEVIKSYQEMDHNEVEDIIINSDKEFHSWKNTAFNERSEKMKKAAEILRAGKDELAELITREMGKPVLQSKGEIEKCAWVCDYFADNGEEFLKDEKIKTEASNSFIKYNPLGVILAVMPWNFPFWQVFRFAAPNLMAGNAGILKHSSNVMGCALAIEDVFREAGFPENLFRSIIISSGKVESVIKNSLIRGVTLTGSVPAGKAVAAAAGSVLKKTVMELGGSDPYIILEDADIETAAGICVNSRLINNGQSCIAAKRFIIVEAVYNEFRDHFINKMFAKKMGDPFNEEIDLGPQARTDLRDELQKQVIECTSKGAEVSLGGEIPQLLGAYYPATVLENVKPGTPAYDDEIFGPVAALIKVKDANEAVRTANDSIFGLGAAVFTSDKSKGEKIAAEELNAGCCFVNDSVKSDPRLPFGGIKDSGYGRELSVVGMREFLNIKTVVVK